MPQQNNLTVKNVSASGFDLYPASLPAITSDYEVTVTAIMSDGTELEEKKTITLEVLPVESITITGDSTITDYDTHYYTLNFIRTTDNKTPNVGDKEFTTTTSDTGITVTKTETGFSLKADSGSVVTKNVTVNIRAVLDDDEIVTSSKIILINLVKITGATISGENSIKSPRNVTKTYLFSYSPNNYTVSPEIPTVTSSSNKVTISNITIVGFDATYDIANGDSYNTTLTATFPDSIVATFQVAVAYGVEPNTHAVGEIYCSDGSYITPTLDWTNGTCTSINLEGKTPIGIVVVPGSHTPDGTARIMSLLECDLSNPSTPTTTHNTIYWGGKGTDTSLTNYTTVPKLDGTTNSWGYTGTKWSYSSMTTSQSGLYYYNDSNKLKSPYLSDGVSQDTSSLVGAMSDFDGRGNTDTLISLATGDSNWRTGSITNSYSSGYYPAACACYRYNTPGTQKGDWYLPACGELVYVIYYIKLFQSILSKLNTLNSGSAVEMNTGYYWSSSEYSNYTSYYVGMGYGDVSNYNKNLNYRVRPFSAV